MATLKPLPVKDLPETLSLWQQNRYLVLLVVLVGLLCAHPFFEDNSFEVTMFSGMVSIMLISNIFILTSSNHRRLIGILLAVPEVIVIWLHHWTGHSMAEILKFVFFVPFHIFVISCIFRDLFAQNRITAEEVRGGICIYILMGATWSALYYLIELLHPGSFINEHAVRSAQLISWADLLYFSFVTQANLGFGDITPVWPFARSLVILESIMGVFYIAVFMSKMVTLFIRHSEEAA
ncbi:MAG: potassium channel family protein [Candidatus Melainabacteria bacterium]